MGEICQKGGENPMDKKNKKQKEQNPQ